MFKKKVNVAKVVSFTWRTKVKILSLDMSPPSAFLMEAEKKYFF